MRSGPRAAAVRLLALAALGAACGAQPDAQAPPAPSATVASQREEGPMMESSRPAPPRVDPVVRDGVRYEQVMNALDLGHDQLNGYLAAYDDSTDQRLWTLKVYEVATDPSVEDDVQEVYFSEMRLAGNGDRLVVENELGERFEVGLEDRSVVRLD